MIDKLIAHGHEVQVGLNPYIPEWCEDVEEYARVMYAHGVREAVIQSLHFSSDRKKLLTDRERESLSDEIIKRAMSRIGVTRGIVR